MVDIKEEFVDLGDYEFPDNAHLGWDLRAIGDFIYKAAPDFHAKDYNSIGAILRSYGGQNFLIRALEYDQKCGQALTSLDINKDGVEDIVFSCP